jgi:hypothetical protein
MIDTTSYVVGIVACPSLFSRKLNKISPKHHHFKQPTTMTLFHQPVTKNQIAFTIGMSVSKLRTDMIYAGIKIEHHRRLSPREAEDVITRLGYDPTDSVIIQRANEAQGGRM